MSRRLHAGVALTWLAVSVSLFAANVWESKPFHAWTDEELEKVLTNSPWAGKASITYVHTRPQPIQDEATVTWVSARVMRQALARQEFGPTPELPRDVAAIIAREPSFYIVRLRISKGPASAGYARQAEAMQDETFLQLPGKPPIPAVQVEGEVIGKDGKPLPEYRGPPAVRGAVSSTDRSRILVSALQRGGAGGGGTRGGSVGGGQRGGDGRNGGRAGRGGRGAFGGPASGASSLLTFRFHRDALALEDREVEFVTKLCGSSGGLPFVPELQPLNSASAPQRGGIGVPGDPGGIVQPPAPAQVPACNYSVKKKFKLKDMVVKGELDL